MKEIIKEFIHASPLQKLSTIANISTILGVSIATFIAGPFLSELIGKRFDLADFLLAILFYFVCIVSVGHLFIYFSKKSYENFRNKEWSSFFGTIVGGVFVFWIVLIVFPHVRYGIGFLFNVNYFLPPQANEVVRGISNDEILGRDGKYEITGKVFYKDKVDNSDYRVLLFIRGFEEASFRIHEYRVPGAFGFGSKYSSSVSSDGKFLIPDVTGLESKIKPQLYLVVVRGCDWSFWRGLGSPLFTGPGYPNNMTHFPNNKLDKLGAFYFEVKT